MHRRLIPGPRAYEELHTEGVKNSELTGEDPVVETISRFKWRWMGHTLRKPASGIVKRALDRNPGGNGRGVGRRKPGGGLWTKKLP
jgi:hypothetical protein